MLEGLTRFLEDFIRTLTLMNARLERLANRFLEALIIFLEIVYRHLADVTRRIVNYLERLMPLMGRLILALLRLAAFYIPSVILLVIFTATQSTVMIIAAVIWAIFITTIGLTYKRHR